MLVYDAIKWHIQEPSILSPYRFSSKWWSKALYSIQGILLPYTSKSKMSLLPVGQSAIKINKNLKVNPMDFTALRIKGII